MLKKRDRLTTKDIAGLSLGRSVFGTLLSLRFVPSKKTGIAVAPSKKIFHRAVDRVRVRRRIYVAAGDSLAKVKKPFHGMIMPKKECLDAPMDNLRAETSAVLKKAGLLG